MAHAFTVQDVEILVATMHRYSLDFLGEMFPEGWYAGYNILVVNQTDPGTQLVSGFPNVRIINTAEKGLSKSRNMALQHAVGKLCVITDDDVVFEPGFAQKIVDASNERPDAALMVFRASDGLGRLYKKYPQEVHHTMSQTERLSVMSIEMVINRSLVQQAGARFDERFGLGSTFTMGEEAVFVNGLYKKGLTILSQPELIVSHASEDTHKLVTIPEKYYIQGALCSVLFRAKWLLWVLIKIAYELKNRKLSPGQVPVAIKAARRGRRALLRYE